MEKITPKFIREAELPAGKKQVIFWDAELPNFGLRLTQGSKSFVLDISYNGKRHRKTIGRHDVLSPSEARNKARKLLTELTDVNPVMERPVVPTLQEVLDRYLSVRPLKETTAKRFRYNMEKYLPDWLPLAVSAITKSMVEVRFQELTSAPTRCGTPGKGRANIVMQNLNTLLKFAIEDYELDMVNPAQTLTRNRAWHRLYPRQGVVPDSQLADWYRSVMGLKNKNHRDYFLLLIFTGFRRATAAQLTWSQVSFEDKVITIPPEASKSYREQRLPMSDFVFDLLKQRYDDRTSECVFPRRYVRNPKKYMSFVGVSHEVVRRESGCQFALHDCRRTFLTIADRLGLPLSVLKMLANHGRRRDVTMSYLVVDIEWLQQPKQQITDRFFELTNAKSSGRAS